MNYYQHKAYFAAIELKALEQEINEACKRNQFVRLDLLMVKYDKLVAKFNKYDKQAKARLTLNNTEGR